jgi:hypothetical protein
MTTPRHHPSTPEPQPLPAPVPEGDVVPGEPPVPITVWHIPRAPGDPAVPAALGRRLVANYTRPGRATVDLTSTAPAPRTTRRPSELVITQWPPPAHPQPDPSAHLASCAVHLGPGGCLAVVVHEPPTYDILGVLVGAGRAAGLTYLQHIVVVHHLHTPSDDEAAQPTDAARLKPGQVHVRVHTDVLVFRRPGLTNRSSRTGSRP